MVVSGRRRYEGVWSRWLVARGRWEFGVVYREESRILV